MKAIDEYLNQLYKNSKNEEVLELKEEMREHLFESVNELINEGFSEDEAIKKAIIRFDGGSDMVEEIHVEYI
ncbi:permease prefix domain 1-containing protein [Metaclostridioides mangenotii]|uniref:permease prefix domain 1-containing protein n=1 Tax=Metaclostridioides mangenotii TaxID=1540 RepID=UPI0028E8184B|nr:permease prefix domain 1-containing protein [Clostridioides mangenotii]